MFTPAQNPRGLARIIFIGWPPEPLWYAVVVYPANRRWLPTNNERHPLLGGVLGSSGQSSLLFDLDLRVVDGHLLVFLDDLAGDLGRDVGGAAFLVVRFLAALIVEIVLHFLA